MIKIAFSLLLYAIVGMSAPQLDVYQFAINSLGMYPFISTHHSYHNDTKVWFSNTFNLTYLERNILYFDYTKFHTLTHENSSIPINNLYNDGFLKNSTELWLHSPTEKKYAILYAPDEDKNIIVESSEINIKSTGGVTKGIDGKYWFYIYDKPTKNDTLVLYDSQKQQWTYYDTANSGLSNNNITKIFADSYGNIWSAHQFTAPVTKSSIDRMDSTGQWYRYARVHTYDPYNGWYWVVHGDTDFTLPFVKSMDEDKKGNVWFGCLNSVTRFDGKNFHSYVMDTTIFKPSSFTKFIQTPTGDTVWFTNDSGAVAKWDGSTVSFYTSAATFPDLTRPYAYIDKHGDRWQTFDYYTYDSYSGQYTYYPTQHAVYSLAEKSWFVFDTCSWWDSTIQVNSRNAHSYNPNGGFWFTKDKKNLDNIPYSELFYLDRTGYKRYSFYTTGLANDTISAIASTDQQDYFAHKFGLSYRNRKDSLWNCWRIEDFAATGNFLIDSVSTLATDKNGALWAGTNSTYSTIPLAKYDGSTWVFFDSAKIGSSSIRTLTPSAESVWIGTKKGVARYVDGTFTRYDTVPPVTSLATAKKGTVWCATDSGVWKYDGSWSTVLAGSFSSVAVDTNDVAWFGNGTSSLVRVAGSHIDTLTIQTECAVSVLTADSFGNIWVGTDKGVSKWNGSSWTWIDSSNSELQSNQIGSIAIGRDGSKWFGTKFNGIAHLTDDESVNTIADRAKANVQKNLSMRQMGGSLTISGIHGLGTVTVADLRGRVVWQERVNTVQGSVTVSPVVGKGIYVARVSSGNQMITQKVFW